MRAMAKHGEKDRRTERLMAEVIVTRKCCNYPTQVDLKPANFFRSAESFLDLDEAILSENS
jgi:hypothetical protein